MKLIPRIKERRMEAHMSQVELSNKSGIDQGQISQYEKGRRLPTLINAWKIAKTIGCHVDDLFSDE